MATAAQLQQQQQQAVQRAQQILPQNGNQIRPASSVSTQTAQNQSLLKQKMRTKQTPVRPALQAMKTEAGQVQPKTQTMSVATAAGLQQLNAAVAQQQQQQQQPTMHQVVTSAGNK